MAHIKLTLQEKHDLLWEIATRAMQLPTDEQRKKWRLADEMRGNRWGRPEVRSA